jgi:hypothetical protein
MPHRSLAASFEPCGETSCVTKRLAVVNARRRRVGKESLAPLNMGVVLGAVDVDPADVDLGMCNAYRLKTFTV